MYPMSSKKTKRQDKQITDRARQADRIIQSDNKLNSIYNYKTYFLNELIGRFVNTRRPEIINSQSLTIKLLLHESQELMILISSCWTMNF